MTERIATVFDEPGSNDGHAHYERHLQVAPAQDGFHILVTATNRGPAWTTSRHGAGIMLPPEEARRLRDRLDQWLHEQEHGNG